jgi:hypothetical protein
VAAAAGGACAAHHHCLKAPEQGVLPCSCRIPEAWQLPSTFWLHVVLKSPQVSIMRDITASAQAGHGGHCVLFVDDSIAEHISDGFEGFNCVRVLFTRGAQSSKGDDDL